MKLVIFVNPFSCRVGKWGERNTPVLIIRVSLINRLFSDSSSSLEQSRAKLGEKKLKMNLEKRISNETRSLHALIWLHFVSEKLFKMLGNYFD